MIPVFLGEQNYYACRTLLGEALQREQGALNAYVLMTNHVHPLNLAFGAEQAQPTAIYRGLFTEAIEDAPINDLRMALNQPINDLRYYAQIGTMTRQGRELRKRGRPRKKRDGKSLSNPGQGELPL